MFNKCNKHVLIELCRSFCTTFHCPYFWTVHKKATYSKIRIAYNNVFRKLLGLFRRSTSSEMFVMNNILNFEAIHRKSVFFFKTHLSNSNNTIISTLQSSWVITDTIWKVWRDKLYVKTLVIVIVFYLFLETKCKEHYIITLVSLLLLLLYDNMSYIVYLCS